MSEPARSEGMESASPPSQAPHAVREHILSTRRRATLEALCRRIAPDAYARAHPTDLAARVEERLRVTDPAIVSQLLQVLSIIEHPLALALTTRQIRRFSHATGAEQDALLRGWELSRLPLARTVFQAARRLILSTYYSIPSVQRSIGYQGPLHLRTVTLPWEGPLPGDPSDEDPVARAGELRVAAQERASVVPANVIGGASLPGETRLHADVCVIGSGAGGAVAAARLAEAGYDVIVLEEGGWYSGADFGEDEALMTPRLYAEAGARATEDLSVSILQGRCAGGGSTINWLIMLRTPDWVLEEWTREHGTIGMLPRDLGPVFEEIEQETHTREVPEDAHSPNNRIILDGAKALGWHASAGRINTRDCVRSGFCGLGCRYGARQGSLAVYLPRALEAGARLYVDVRADRLELLGRAEPDGRKRVHATVLDRERGVARASLTVDAKLVILAGGAVGTPTLLQRSALGNAAVGKYLRLHPTTSVIGTYEREIYGAAGIPLSAMCDEFLHLDRNGYGSWIECPPLLPALASVAVPGFGAAHREVMTTFPKLGALIVLVRDGAGRDGSNGDVRVDKRGRPRIRYRLMPHDRDHLLVGMRAAARLHFAAGATETRTLHAAGCRMQSVEEIALIDRQRHGPNDLALFSAHVNGTCRMGDDPRTSGCTPDGEVRGARGVFVVDGSLLPTALGVNPQETIMALASVVSARIVARGVGRGRA